MKTSIIKASRLLFVILFWIFIWELGSLFINNDILLPSPIAVAIALGYLSLKGYFWLSVLSSVGRVLVGLFLSIGIGILLGIAAGLNKYVEELLNPLLITIKSTPIMSIIILALVWFKSTNVAVFTAILVCFPIIYTNVLQGIKSVDPQLIQMANIYKVKDKYIIKDIYVPSIKHYIISGVLMCLGLGWKVSVTSEVLATPKYSIGLNLLTAKTTLETAELFAWTVVVVLLSFAFELAFKYYVKKTDKLSAG
ncbi:MAG: ABC transporter permease [Solirubrobacterales bacterium]